VKIQAACIDLSSDTVTRPSDAMRQAMMNATVGDESKHQDPTVNELCERVASLLGQDRALLLPSGTMCNHIAALVYCKPGERIIVASNSHMQTSESSGTTVLAGAMLSIVESADGTFSPEQVQAHMPEREGTRFSRIAMLSLEQTHNRSGGRVWPAVKIETLAQYASDNNQALHIDGARIMNAARATSTAPITFAQHADSVWMSFTKGLGCPFGSVLAGSNAFIEQAWEWKYRLGGGMRQAGIMAAGCLYALDHHIEQLDVDHRNAARLASYIEAIDGLSLVHSHIDTNMVFFSVEDSNVSYESFCATMEKSGVRVGVENNGIIRAVTHRDISATDIERVAEVCRQAMQTSHLVGRSYP